MKIFLLCCISEEIFSLVHLFLQATSRFYRSRFPFSQVHSICIFYYLCLVYKDIFILQHLFLEADCKVQSVIFSHSQCGCECFPPFCSNLVIKCAPPTSFSRILFIFYKSPEIRHLRGSRFLSANCVVKRLLYTFCNISV